jgi:dihydroflavonol-4-reductase
MAKVLVTGGSGFVGRNLLRALCERGDEVRSIDVAEPQERIAGVEYRTGSILDRDAMLSALEGVDRLYHLAGIAHLWAPTVQRFDDINRRGTETVLDAAREMATPRVVHCSTESILLPNRRGNASGGPVNEDLPLTVEDMPGPYTRSKLRGEQAARQAAAEGMNLTIVNPTVPVGAGDENMTPPAMMLELFLRGGSPMYLDCTLNFVDVRDVAAGIVLAGDKGRQGERYILSGDNMRLGELLRLLENISGRKMPTRRVPGRLALTAGIVSEALSRFTGRTPAATREGVLIALRSASFDNAKARRELGYAPRPAEDALRAEIAWLAERNGIRLASQA